MKKYALFILCVFMISSFYCGGGGSSDPTNPTNSTGSTYTISGTVSGSLTGATITLSGTANDSTTTASGAYSFTGLANGTYTVTPSMTGYIFTPTSRLVTVSGADVTVDAFTATLGTSYTISGTVTGSWFENVTITLAGDNTGNALTEDDGTYSFTVGAGTYTVTPELDGYTFSPVSPSIIVSTADVIQDFVTTSDVTSYSISGTITYAGSKTGRVYVIAEDNNDGNNRGTSITLSSGTGTYKIKGVVNTTYDQVRAYMDIIGNVSENANNPSGSISSLTVSGNMTGQNITLTDPTVTVATPEINVLPSANSILVFVEESSTPTAIAYKIYSGATSGSRTTFLGTCLPGSDFISFMTSATSGSSLYYTAVPVNGSGADVIASQGTTTSAITIGNYSGSYTISGTITYACTSSVPLYIIVYNEAEDLFFTRVMSSTSGTTSYSIPGLAAGTYGSFAIADVNANNIIDIGDIGSDDEVMVSVSGNTTINKTITASTVDFSFTSQYQVNTGLNPYTGYGLQAEISNGTKQPVVVTLYSGVYSGLAVPIDICYDSEEGGFRQQIQTDSSTVVGDNYKFKITYSDGTTGYATKLVSGVMTASNAVTGLTVTSTASARPTITWIAPASLPAGYTAEIRVQPYNGGDDMWEHELTSGELAGGTIVYDGDDDLISATSYQIQIIIYDSYGNEAQASYSYTTTF